MFKQQETLSKIFVEILKRTPILIESDPGKNFYEYIFQTSLNKNNIKQYSLNSSLSVLFAERFKRTDRDLLERPVFEKRDGNWVDVLGVTTKQNNSRVYSSSKLPPNQGIFEKLKGLHTQIY